MDKKVVFMLALVLGLLMPTYALDYYAKLVKVNATKDVNDYQFMITFDSSNFDGWDKLNDNCDIQVKDMNDNLVPYYVEKCDKQNMLLNVWIKANLSVGENDFLVYYGNVNSYSDPNTVFDFYDDFKNLNMDNYCFWDYKTIYCDGTTEADHGMVYILNGDQLVVRHTTVGSGSNGIFLKNNITYPFIWELKVDNHNALDGDDVRFGYVWHSPASSNPDQISNYFWYHNRWEFPISVGVHDGFGDKPVYTSATFLSNKHFIISVKDNSGNVLFTKDHEYENPVITTYNNEVSASPSIGIASYSGDRYVLIDWARVRKYSDVQINYEVENYHINQAPVVEIIEPQDGYEHTELKDVVIKFKAYDIEDSHFHLVAYLNDSIIYEDNSYANNTVITKKFNLDNGYYILKVVATDNEDKSNQKEINFKVNIDLSDIPSDIDFETYVNLITARNPAHLVLALPNWVFMKGLGLSYNQASVLTGFFTAMLFITMFIRL